MLLAPPKAPTSVLSPESDNRDWLEPLELDTLSPSAVLERLRAIGPLIADAAGEAERNRRPVNEVLSAIRRTGLFYLYKPSRFGGVETRSMIPLVDTVALIAEYDASAAWCACFTVNHQWVLAQFPQSFQEEVYSITPYMTSAGSGFPPGKLTEVEGGFRASGRFQFGSGIMHAAWTTSVGIVEKEDGSTIPYFFNVPIDEVTVYDTWHTDGMRGTGSHDYEMRDVYVPAHRAVDYRKITRGQLHHDNPLYRLPLVAWQGVASSAVALGAARGAVQRYRQRLAAGGAGHRERTTSGPVDNSLMHFALGKADLLVTAADSMIRKVIVECESLAAAGEPIGTGELVRLRAMLSFAVQECRQALRLVVDSSGTGVHQISDPNQRALRDVTVLASHVAFDFTEAMQLQGRLLIGLPSNNRAFN